MGFFLFWIGSVLPLVLPACATSACVIGVDSRIAT